MIMKYVSASNNYLKNRIKKIFSFSYFHDNKKSYYSIPGLLENFLEKTEELRYGENPHQKGLVFRYKGETGGILNAELLNGIPMSYLNYIDADIAWNMTNEFEEHTCAIIKHTNPCGLSVRDNQLKAFNSALNGDRRSAFGYIVGFNSTVEMETVEAMERTFFDVIVAPDYQAEALDKLRLHKRVRVLKVNDMIKPINLELRSVSGGLLIQNSDSVQRTTSDWKVVSKRVPYPKELNDLYFAYKTCKFVSSNGIVLAKDNAIIGIGAGQPNRVGSVDLAMGVAGEYVNDSVMASDAFFPFIDGIHKATEAGVTAIVQPGGSKRDKEIIAEVDKYNATMLFTGIRHFSH